VTTVIPWQGHARRSGVPPLCGENGFIEKLLPDPANHKQVHTDAHCAWTALA